MTVSMTKRPIKAAWVTSQVKDRLEEIKSRSSSKRGGQDIKEFAESTSAHGIKNAVSENSHRFRRTAWFLAFLTALTYLTYQLVACCIDYRRYPIQTENRLSRMDAMDFPTATICNLNQANADKVDDPQAITNIFRVAKGGMWPETLNTTLEKMKNDAVHGPYLERNYKELLEQMSWDVDEVFNFCIWNGEMVSCREYLTPVWTLIGKCFKLNANASYSLVATRAGSNGGFFATLRTSLDGHTVSEGSAYGFKVLIHHMYDFPDIYSQGLLLSPGFSYHVGFLKERIKYLPYPYKAQGDMYCKDYEKPDHSHIKVILNNAIGSGLHSMTACIFEKANTRATQMCGCCMKNCTLYDYLACFMPSFNRLYDEATKMDIFGCAIPCTIHSYRPVISQAGFPAPDLLQLDTMVSGNDSDMGPGLCLGLSLFFEDLMLRERVHIPLYSSLSLMGMIGGNMGLLLGASLLTLAELLEFLMFLAWKVVRRSKGDNPNELPQ